MLMLLFALVWSLRLSWHLFVRIRNYPEVCGLTMIKTTLTVFSHGCFAVLLLVSVNSANAMTPEQLGVHEGKLAPCPNAPHCVASQNANPQQYIAPLQYAGTASDARQRLVEVISSLERSRIETLQDDYIHSTFRSRWFGFVDDVEFLILPETGLIQVRSSSRSGYYDFNVNRNRMEIIRKRFAGQD